MMLGNERELDDLLRAYNESVQIPEPTARFMPNLWERIDGRRAFTLRLKRLSQVFVGGAAVLCLVLGGVTAVYSPRPVHAQHATYLDVLAEAHPTENLTAIGIMPRPENPEAKR